MIDQPAPHRTILSAPRSQRRDVAPQRRPSADAASQRGGGWRRYRGGRWRGPAARLPATHPAGAFVWSVSVRPRTDPWRGCGWCPWTAPLIIDIKRRSGTRGLQLCRCKPPPKPAKLHDPAELFAQQAKSVLALLAPKDVTETRLRVGRVSCAASGRPPGVSTVRASRRGHDADVILARGSQYSTQPASASHAFSTKLQLGKKEKKIEIDFR